MSNRVYNASNMNPLSPEYLLEVALGNVTNDQYGDKFGRNPEVDTTTDPEDMWNGGSAYTGHPLSHTPNEVNIYSASANDNSGSGTGARTIRIFGLESPTSKEYTSEDITMHATDGTIAVTSTKTWWRVNRAYVLTAGSTGRNEGVITVEDSTDSAIVFIQMPLFGQTTIGCWTVPAGKKAILWHKKASIARLNGSAGSANVSLNLREVGGAWLAKRVLEISTSAPHYDSSPIIAEAGTDIKWTIDFVSDNDTASEGFFDYILIPDL
jgi:hypothetical protein